jgi:hypothetical protein
MSVVMASFQDSLGRILHVNLGRVQGFMEILLLQRGSAKLLPNRPAFAVCMGVKTAVAIEDGRLEDGEYWSKGTSICMAMVYMQ